MLGHLRSICSDVLSDLDDLEQRDYDADARLVRGEEAMFVSPDRINAGSPVIAAINSINNLPEIGGRAAAAHKISWYAIAFGQGEDLTLFVRRRIEQFAGRTRLIGLAGDSLHPSPSPVLIFDFEIDLVVRREGIVAFNERAFEGLIRAPQDVQAELVDNIDSIAEALPIHTDTIEALKDRALKRPMIRRKLRSIIERGHLRDIQITDIAKRLKEQGFQRKLYIAKGELQFDMRHALLFLRFLDEGTWLGAFSRTLYASDGKSPVTQGTKD
jgi:hypothetical protein